MSDGVPTSVIAPSWAVPLTWSWVMRFEYFWMK
jgi:hypothetical protein